MQVLNAASPNEVGHPEDLYEFFCRRLGTLNNLPRAAWYGHCGLPKPASVAGEEGDPLVRSLRSPRRRLAAFIRECIARANGNLVR